MKVIWKGDASNAPACRLYGAIFPVGRSEDISMLPETQQVKLANNPNFEPGDKEAEALRRSSPVPDVQTNAALKAEAAGPVPALTEQIRDLSARLARAEAENAELRASLDAATAPGGTGAPAQGGDGKPKGDTAGKGGPAKS